MKRKGYTLIELIVVVALIGMFVTIATPYFLKWLRQYRLQSAAVVLANHLRATRLLAVYKGVKHQVQLKPFGEGNYYQVVEDPDGLDKPVMSIGRVVLDKRFGGVMITDLPVGGRISFFPRGTSRNATIALENSAGTRIEIIINSHGRVNTVYL